ncbi:zona pellucida-binding protein 2-like [Gopherus evgoodei]|uniref:zona pellucida-binding protein 2-like n=1 Tax=Gopherus evgoodei TaxID=1825980 RepID=UPI0011CF9B3D|nr:zona pellucida-binding protein 2-like [Gopherus evgoodei]
MDQVYRWTKDTGQEIQDSKYCSILENGSLAFKDFGPEQSGIYKCSVSYSKEDKRYTKHFHFFVRAYHRPDRSVEIQSAFYSPLCSSATNSIYIHSFLEHLNGLVRNLSCEVFEKYTKCIWPLQERNDSEVWMTVLMFPYGVMWEIHCPPESMSKNCEQDIEDRSKETCHFYNELHRILGSDSTSSPKCSMNTSSGNNEEDIVDEEEQYEENGRQAGFESTVSAQSQGKEGIHLT